MAPVEDPEAKIRIRVESLFPFCPRSIRTRSKWCFDPTKSLTTLEGLDVKGGLPADKVPRLVKRPQPLSSKTGLLVMVLLKKRMIGLKHK